MSRLDRRRVKKIITDSREGMPEDCKEIALADIRRVLEEYFALQGNVDLNLQPTKEGYLVRIDFMADRVKVFHIVH